MQRHINDALRIAGFGCNIAALKIRLIIRKLKVDQLVRHGIFILIYPQHIEKLVKEVFPRLRIRQIALVELIVGIAILAMRTAAKRL